MEEKRQKLIEKMTAEHMLFKASLLEMSKADILQQAEKYCMQRIILSKLPEIGIHEEDYDTLLQMEHPLADVVDYISSFDYECTESISACLIEIAGGDSSCYG